MRIKRFEKGPLQRVHLYPHCRFSMDAGSDERLAWLGLSMIEGLGSQGFKNLMDTLGHPAAVFAAGPEVLSGIKGLNPTVVRRIVRRELISDPEAELQKLERLGARIIPFTDPEYPALLSQISYPPKLLYAWGKKVPAKRTLVALVGSRHPTHYGIKAAEEMGEGLARRDVGVVSGLAKGIDSASHRGCLKANGYTIGVLGTGLDVTYPRGNEKLLNRIVNHGTVISEFPLGTPPEPKNFPIRNRIISGLCRGVVVVEATRKSGSLITASFALDQGRDVFAVPGSIHSFKSTGTHHLIKQGAKLIEHTEDILEELHLSFKPELPLFPGAAAVNDLAEPERKICDLLGDYPLHIDEIVRRLDLDPGEALSLLMKLELAGEVKQLPGKMFVIN